MEMDFGLLYYDIFFYKFDEVFFQVTQNIFFFKSLSNLSFISGVATSVKK